MGFSPSISTNPNTISSDLNSSKNDELKFKTLLQKMIWEFGLGCILPPCLKKDENDGKKDSSNTEHNKAWLLAESGGCGSGGSVGGAELGNGDPQSVHSSFRFSFCSQVELESMNVGNSASATVLMVNLDNGLIESRSQEVKWRRIESLERSISPIAHSLIRFRYEEIVSATSGFSKGIKLISCFTFMSL